MAAKQTPLTRQYTQIKNKYPDTVLLFRLGDFFETFNEDAVITSKVCGITLTKRNNGAAGEMPLAGFPHHQLDNYLPKLVRAGYRVAVCEQLEDPKRAKGIVRRDVVEVVTPGAALYDKLLDTKKNNYLAAINLGKIRNYYNAGLAFTDISTGEFFVCETEIDKLADIIESFAPAEILINKTYKNELLNIIENLSYKPALNKIESWIFDDEFSRDALNEQFGTLNLKGFGIEDFHIGIASAGCILHYLKETQKGTLKQIKTISAYNPSAYMQLDFATRRNLEITFSMQDNTKDGTLISILDKTATPMGGRLFKKWLSQPLIELSQIKRRLGAVRLIIENNLLEGLKYELSQTGDIERLISKICTARANPRDVVSLKHSLGRIPELKNVLAAVPESELSRLRNELDDLTEIYDMIDKSLIDEPTSQTGTGSVFRKGYSSDLDNYVDAKFSGKNWLSDYKESERERTNIPSLKIGFNNVFGYYIEVSNTHKNKIPANYERKQTLTNAERYITPELKEFESKILNAEEKIAELEQSLFSELLMKIALFTSQIQKNAYLIAQIDSLYSFASASVEYEYTEPEIDESGQIQITEGRHPVVERLLPIGEHFQTNSTILDTNGEMIHIITGPNMAGKSCYLRQVGLIVFLTQIGCFVPAKKARIGLVDRIFTRVGAQDNITAGESTFLVEMQEAANIMNNATERSLILLDEVGRGTATFDGISIAWAITEYIHNKLRAKTLFATHYHELNELAGRYDNIANYKIDVREADGKLMFTHQVKKGGTDHSFGIHVAQMAGLPYDVIKRASDIMKTLEAASTDESKNDLKLKGVKTSNIETKKNKRIPDQLAIFEIKDDELRERILNLDINQLTPLQALQILSEMHKEVRKNKK
jgi:DNA mismatch repair protein MutS